jgi:hypothetical protein|tara:strand:+ start:57 stop:299 length:243 start_codon:yes stop_codon:yes gene_type:complete
MDWLWVRVLLSAYKRRLRRGLYIFGVKLPDFMFMLSIFKLDVSEPLQLGFQESASPVMEEIINFHNEVMIYLTFILIGVL